MDTPDPLEHLQKWHEEEFQAEADERARRQAVRADIDAANTLLRIEGVLDVIDAKLGRMEDLAAAMRDDLTAGAQRQEHSAKTARTLEWIFWLLVLLLITLWSK